MADEPAPLADAGGPPPELSEVPEEPAAVVHARENEPAREFPIHTLRGQDLLREALKTAITKDDAKEIQALVGRGAPLYPHYFHGPAGPPCNSPYLQKLGMVNPVDWAVLELRFRAAMQILELSDGRLLLTEVRPRPAKMEDQRVAAQTKMALNVAAAHGHLGLMRMLLERGCWPGQTNLDEESALHVAAKAGRIEAVSLLLQYGAWAVELRQEEVLAAAQASALLPVFEGAGVDLRGLPVVAEDLPPFDPGATRVPSSLRLQAPTSPRRSAPSPDLSQDCSTRAWSPPASVPITPSAGARREAWFKGGLSRAVTHETVYRAGSPRSDGITRSDWGWAPHGSLPSTPTAAAAGGAVSVPMPGTQMMGNTAVRFLRELTSEEVQLRGELTRAIRKGDIDKIHGLLARGAPLEAAFNLGYGENGNCVDWAVVNGKPKLALSLLSFADQRGQGDSLAQNATAAFHWSITQGYPEVLEDLLRRGADVAQRAPLHTLELWSGAGKQSGLAAAVFGARKAEIALLLKHGAWTFETESQRAQLIEWAMCRKPAAEAFQEAGITGAFEARLESPMKPVYGEASWLQSATPPTRAPTAADGEMESPGQTIVF